jgi:VanZ family protein
VAVINQLKRDSKFLPPNYVVLTTKIVFWIACIVFGFLCLIPTVYLPSELFDWWDKAQHVIAFFFLSIIGTIAYQKFKGRVLTGLFLYGGLIEILQFLTGWRSVDFIDWLADGIGILIGSTFMRLLFQKRFKLLKSLL